MSRGKWSYGGTSQKVERSTTCNQLNQPDRNKFEAFIQHPQSYAMGSEKYQLKIRYLENNIRPKLSHADLVKYYQAKREYESALLNTNAYIAPKCPQCSSEMQRRSGKFGEFWGCTKYPFCKGTLNIRCTHN